MRRGTDTHRAGCQGLACSAGTRHLHAKVLCTPPPCGARAEIEWADTRVEAACHLDRHRGSTPLGSTHHIPGTRPASHAKGLRHSRAGAQTALACSTRLTPRVWGKSQRFKSDLRNQKQKEREQSERTNWKTKQQKRPRPTAWDRA